MNTRVKTSYGELELLSYQHFDKAGHQQNKPLDGFVVVDIGNNELGSIPKKEHKTTNKKTETELVTNQQNMEQKNPFREAQKEKIKKVLRDPDNRNRFFLEFTNVNPKELKIFGLEIEIEHLANSFLDSLYPPRKYFDFFDRFDQTSWVKNLEKNKVYIIA